MSSGIFHIFFKIIWPLKSPGEKKKKKILRCIVVRFFPKPLHSLLFEVNFWSEDFNGIFTARCYMYIHTILLLLIISYSKTIKCYFLHHSLQVNNNLHQFWDQILVCLLWDPKFIPIHLSNWNTNGTNSAYHNYKFNWKIRVIRHK